ncbi:MAG: ferritin family protein [Desulfobaccales bacterium]
MNLKGTKTEKNLLTTFAGEAQARNRYTYYASVAKKAGYELIAAIFLETADNEKEHAKVEKFHEERYRVLLERVKNDTFFNRTDPLKWHCRNRGYVASGDHPPDPCPACRHPKAYYEPLPENWR